jgi:hypothetical protein
VREIVVELQRSESLTHCSLATWCVPLRGIESKFVGCGITLARAISVCVRKEKKGALSPIGTGSTGTGKETEKKRWPAGSAGPAGSKLAQWEPAQLASQPPVARLG